MTDKVKDKNLEEVAGGKHIYPDSNPTPQETFSFKKGETIYGDRMKLSYYRVLDDATNVASLADVFCDAYNNNKIIASNTAIKATVLASLRESYNN